MKLQKKVTQTFAVKDYPDGVTYTLRYIPPGEEEEIKLRASIFEFVAVEDESGSKTLERRLRRGASATDLHAMPIAALVGWTGFMDEDGNPLELTPWNVVQVMREYPELWEQIEKDRLELTEKVLQKRKDAAKN